MPAPTRRRYCYAPCRIADTALAYGNASDDQWSNETTMPWVSLIDENRCRLNAGVFLEVAGFELAVFRLTDPDRVVVMDNACPHSGGNLSAGAVEDGCVTCPLHDWRFSLTTGVCTDSKLARVHRYQAELRDDVVWADLPAGSTL